MITKTGLVITGGDDKIIRAWTIFGDEKNKFKKAKLLHELKHHMGPITSLCEHPNKSWVIIEFHFMFLHYYYHYR